MFLPAALFLVALAASPKQCETNACVEETLLLQKGQHGNMNMNIENVGVGSPGYPTKKRRNVFPHGVAAGDATESTVVLWARVLYRGLVRFYIRKEGSEASSSRLAGKALVSDLKKPAKVLVKSLSPGTKYIYTVVVGRKDGRLCRYHGLRCQQQRTGTFMTAGSAAGPLRFGAAGDWRGSRRPYQAISNVVSRDLRFFVELGDTVYADFAEGETNYVAKTLDEFRGKHIEVYSAKFGANYWADVRSNLTIYSIIDDHEVTNDFQGGANHSPVHVGDELVQDNYAVEGGTAEPGEITKILFNQGQLYKNGLQAFDEYNPIETLVWNNSDPVMNGRPKLYRYRKFGPQACMIIVDTRSFRDEALFFDSTSSNATDVQEFVTKSYTEDRTFLGKPQLEQLKQDLQDCQDSDITWKFVVVSVPIHAVTWIVSGDRWYGYARERNDLLDFIKKNIANVVFISADIHSTFVSDVAYQPLPWTSPILPGPLCNSQDSTAIEVTTGSVGMVPYARSLLVSFGTIPLATFGFPIPAGLTFNTLLFFAISQLEQTDVKSLEDYYQLELQAQDKYSAAAFQLFDYFAATPGGLFMNPVGFGFPPCQDILGALGAFEAALGGDESAILQAFLVLFNYMLTLTDGPYKALNTFGWTEFEVSPDGQSLNVTTYGLAPYESANKSILEEEVAIMTNFKITAK